MRRFFPGLLAALLLTAGACDDSGGSGDGGGAGGFGGSAPGAFGEVTSAVVIVNPRINQGSSTTVEPGDERAGLAVSATGAEGAVTDSTGLAVLTGMPVGPVTVSFDEGSVDFTVVQERELYDLVLAVRADGVEEIVATVRYPIGGAVVVLEPGGDIAAAAAADGTIVILRPGTYPGGFELRAEGVLVFGAWSPIDGPTSVIEGDVAVLGGNGRLRGVRIEGLLTTSANGFSAAFSDIDRANVTGNGVSLIRNRFLGGQATVPSSNAVLVDNEGIP